MYDQHDIEALERQFNAAMEEADTGSALDAVRRIYDEFDRGGAGLAALLHPDFQLRMETVFIEGKSYKGQKGYERWRGEMEELFESDSFKGKSPGDAKPVTSSPADAPRPDAVSDNKTPEAPSRGAIAPNPRRGRRRRRVPRTDLPQVAGVFEIRLLCGFDAL